MSDSFPEVTLSGRVLLLSGGVGGAKLAGGMAALLAPSELSIVVNTADDFRHLGLAISPDLDSVSYMLASMADEERGWGRSHETWSCMEALAALGGEAWFRLGDRDLAQHLHRTSLLSNGMTLSQATAVITTAMGIHHAVLPMTDDAVATVIETAAGDLAFQDYFVRQMCQPIATGYRYEGIGSAAPSPDFLTCLQGENLAGIVIAPSNPFLSIGPILALNSVRHLIRAAGVPVIAVSPLIGGNAVKGPAAKLMKELGYASDSTGLAALYGEMADILVVDRSDPMTTPHKRMKTVGADIMMSNAAGRRRVASFCLSLLQTMGKTQ
jgi:LPPG:FO 2-phospho-L-lactate transferase